MTDNWDDSDDEWDIADDQLDERLGLKKAGTDINELQSRFDDEEDLAIKERAELAKRQNVELKKKGNALLEKKRAEQERLEELELNRKALELEAELEANLSIDKLRALKQKQVEDADHALTNDLFGAEQTAGDKQVPVAASAPSASDAVVLKDVKDHLKHARRVAEAMKAHGKIHLATAFFKEALQESKDVMDDDSVTELIKTLNVIKNEKVAAAKRKVKGQANKSKKVDKVAAEKAREIQIETFGDNDKFDQYDVIGEDYEDSFF